MSEVLEAPISESPAASALESFVPTEKPDLHAPGNKPSSDETPPDFSKLGKKEEPVEAPEAKERTPEPKKETKPASEAPSAKEKASSETAKPKVESKKPEAKDEPKDKVDESELPDSDEDLDKIQPKPGAPPHVVKSIADLKAGLKKGREVARQYKTQLAEREKEIESLKSQAGKLSPDQQREYDGLKNFHQLFRAQDDPTFKKEYDERIIKSEDGIYGLLAKHGLKPEVTQEIKDAAAKSNGDLEAWAKWPALIDAFKNPLDKQTLLNALQDRRNAIASREGQLQKLQQDRDGFYKDLASKDKAEKDRWASEVAKAAEKDVTGEDWAMEKSIPDGANADAKKHIEEHNAKVKEYGAEWQKNVVAMHARDPKTIATLAFAAVRSGFYKSENDSLTAKLEKSDDRIADLEAQLAKIKGAGRMAHVETAAPENTNGRNKTTTKEGEIGGNGEDAFRTFFGGRR